MAPDLRVSPSLPSLKAAQPPFPFQSQRPRYEKGGVGARYWDYRDRQVFARIGGDSRKILDLGCGEGVTLEKLVALYPDRDVLGIDHCERQVRINIAHGLPVRPESIYQLSCPDDSVDCCILLEVIEHLEHPEKALLEIRRVLRPKGTLIVMFPNDRVAKLARFLAFRFRDAFHDYGHLERWTPRRIAGSLSRCGFEVIARKSIPFGLWSLSLHHFAVARKPA